MNVLQRKMFANGDAVNSPAINLQQLAAYYSSQGYDTAEIFDLLGDRLSFREIENIAKEVGGSVNPGTPGVPNEFTGNFQVFPQIDNSNLSVERNTVLGQRLGNLNPEIVPNAIDITEQLKNIGATESTTNEILAGPKTTQSSSERATAFLPAKKGLDTDLDNLLEIERVGMKPAPLITENPLLIPETSSQDISEIQADSTDIDSNQVIIGDKIWTFEDLNQFEDDVKTGKLDGTDLYPILNALGVKRGSEIQRILDDFAGYDEPEIMPGRIAADLMGVPQEDRAGTAYAPGDFGSAAQNIGLDALRTGQLAKNIGIVGINRLNRGADTILDYILGPDVRGLVGGQRGRERAEARENPPVEDLFELTPQTELKDVAEMRLNQMTGAIRTDSITQDLEDIENQAKPETKITDSTASTGDEEEKDVDDKDFLPEDDFAGDETRTVEPGDNLGNRILDAIKEGGIPENVESVGEVSNDGVGTGEVKYSTKKPPESNFAQFVQSPDFIRFARNLAKGMATTQEFGRGISLGAVAAAEEKYQEEKDAKLLAAELDKERLKKESEDRVSTEKLIELDSNATESAGKIEKAQNTRALMEELRKILKNENPTSIGSFARNILEKAQTAVPELFGKELPNGIESFEELSATGRAQKLATLISQSNIRAILGESSKSISNFDREIVQQLSTQINLGEKAAFNLKALDQLDLSISNDILQNYSNIFSSASRLGQTGQALNSLSALKILEMYPNLEALKLKQGQEQVQVIDLSNLS